MWRFGGLWGAGNQLINMAETRRLEELVRRILHNVNGDNSKISSNSVQNGHNSVQEELNQRSLFPEILEMLGMSIQVLLKVLLKHSIQTKTTVTQITTPDSHPDYGILCMLSQGKEHQQDALAIHEGIHVNVLRFLP